MKFNPLFIVGQSATGEFIGKPGLQFRWNIEHRQSLKPTGHITLCRSTHSCQLNAFKIRPATHFQLNLAGIVTENQR
jgi:hypothetical protein